MIMFKSTLIHKDCLDALKCMESGSVDSLVTDPPAGISFMGKDWDGHKGGRDAWIDWLTEIMRECLRVMKPGAHGLVWAIPRTSHWTATALENAGFEVRDVITHIFGTGFPKSLDVSKAIDKAAGVSPIKGDPKPYTNENIKNNNYDAGGGRERIQTFHTIPATEAAKQWQGWGTALKPASEHWILIRKPCSEKTVAGNVLKHGVGGINIDGCRIDADDQTALAKNWERMQSTKQSKIATIFSPKKQIHLREYNKSILGRFPANLVLDESAAQDLGGVSRFFYVAKASRSDRGENNNHPTVKSTKLMEYLIKLVTPEGGVVIDPFMGSGSTGVAAKNLNRRFIGIEKEKEYFEIATNRIGYSPDDYDFGVGNY